MHAWLIDWLISRRSSNDQITHGISNNGVKLDPNIWQQRKPNDKFIVSLVVRRTVVSTCRHGCQGDWRGPFPRPSQVPVEQATNWFALHGDINATIDGGRRGNQSISWSKMPRIGYFVLKYFLHFREGQGVFYLGAGEGRHVPPHVSPPDSNASWPFWRDFWGPKMLKNPNSPDLIDDGEGVRCLLSVHPPPLSLSALQTSFQWVCRV